MNATAETTYETDEDLISEEEIDRLLKTPVDLDGAADDSAEGIANPQIAAFLNSIDVTSLADSSKDTYRYALNHFDAYCCRRKIETLDASVVSHLPGFVAYLEKRKVGPASIKQYLNIVKIMMRSLGMPIEFTYKIPAKAKKEGQVKQMNRWFDEADIEKCLTIFCRKAKMKRLP